MGNTTKSETHDCIHQVVIDTFRHAGVNDLHAQMLALQVVWTAVDKGLLITTDAFQSEEEQTMEDSPVNNVATDMNARERERISCEADALANVAKDLATAVRNRDDDEAFYSTLRLALIGPSLVEEAMEVFIDAIENLRKDAEVDHDRQ